MENLNTIFDDLSHRLNQHNALNELRVFGVGLKSKALDKAELNIFFGTLWAFFREVPTGILALALRISDDWMSRYDEWEGTSKAAPVLYADVDEFGLQSNTALLPTHHHLFVKLIETLNLDRKHLLDKNNIDHSGKDFGKLTFEYYRIKNIAESIGFHMASELTSSIEFQYFLDGFKAHQTSYGLDKEKQSALSFFHIHTIVEPLHLELGKRAAKNYLEKEPGLMADIEKGAMVFMDGFEAMFHNLNQRFFS